MEFKDYLGIEQAKAVSRNMRTLIISSAFMYLVTAAVLWFEFSNSFLLLVWLGLALALVIARWIYVTEISNESVRKENYEKHLKIHVVLSSINGAMWGSASLFFQTPESHVFTLLLLVALAGYISVTLVSNTLYLPQFQGFVLAATTPFVISFLILDGLFYKLLLVYTLIYTVAMEAFSRVANQNYINSKRIEFENFALLKQVTQEKQAANKAVVEKNHFLAATSHDLRQPLQALGLYINALESQVIEPVAADIISKIKDSNQAINDLLHGLLDISRLDANVIENRPKHTKLFNIANRLREEFEPGLDDQVQFRCLINENETAYIDPVLIERVIRNLLSNAFKYTEQGQVVLKSVRNESTLALIVSDTGVGVPEDKVDYIFTEFTQLRNPERDRNKGLGLGLSIVRRMCELLGIEYDFESTLGKGTQVTLQLPLGDPALVPITDNTETSNLKNISILFVDDEQSIREGAQIMIESWQCQALIASGGEEAMKRIHEHNETINLIISDLRLRDHENGINLIEMVREELNKDIPAIIVTGDTAVDRIELANRSNSVLLHKPIDVVELRRQVVLALRLEPGPSE